MYYLVTILFQVYRGYVDDPRNTDNSWMETVAVNFHDETGSSVGRFNLNAGEDLFIRSNSLYFIHTMIFILLHS